MHSALLQQWSHVTSCTHTHAHTHTHTPTTHPLTHTHTHTLTHPPTHTPSHPHTHTHAHTPTHTHPLTPSHTHIQCSNSCGAGVQHMHYRCRYSATHKKANSSCCAGLPVPREERHCIGTRKCKNLEWHTEPWGEVSACTVTHILPHSVS